MKLANNYELPIIGVLPDGWSISSLGDLLDGGTRNGIYKSKEFHGRGTKIVNMGELFGHSRLGNIQMKRLEVTENDLTKSSLKNGDLLFARRSLTAEGAGKCSIVKCVTEPTVFESSIIRARPDTQKVVPEFLYYIFQSPYGSYILDTIKRTVAVSGITGTDLVTLQIPVPPIARQKAIASILTEIDDKIDLNKQINETIELIAKAIFKEWFIDFGPVKAKSEGKKPFGLDDVTNSLFPDGFEDSELGQIPNGWKSGKLEEIADVIGGGTPSTSEKSYYCEAGSGISWLSPKDLSGYSWKYVSNGATDITESGLKNSSARMLPLDSVLFSSRAPIGYVALAEKEVCTNQGFKSLIPKNDSNSEFLYYFVKANVDLIESRASGSTFKEISGSGMKELPLVIPPPKIMSSFKAIVGKFSSLQKELRHETNNLVKTRDLLLPKLISGELELQDGSNG